MSRVVRGCDVKVRGGNIQGGLVSGIYDRTNLYKPQRHDIRYDALKGDHLVGHLVTLKRGRH